MLQMRVFVEQERAQEVGGLLQSVQGARHVVIVGPTFDGSKTLITAELTPAMTDHVMRRLIDAGVLSGEIDVQQSETFPTIEAGERSAPCPAERGPCLERGDQPGKDERPLQREVRGVHGHRRHHRRIRRHDRERGSHRRRHGARAYLTPVTATCVGLVGRRWRLAGRGLLTLAIGYAFTTFAAQTTSSFLRVTGQLPSGYELPMATVQAVASYSLMIIIIAFAAGVAGIFAFETKAGAAVGVAISVTTIPAAAYVGASIGLGQTTNTAEALVVLGVNVLMLLLGASAGLVVQLAVARRRGLVASAASEQRPGIRSRRPRDDVPDSRNRKNPRTISRRAG